MSTGRFLLLSSILCLLYLGLETVYVARLPLIMDEFQGAWSVHQLLDEVPYRDFQPYKTVLGYYLQLPVLAAVPGLWNSLLAVKVEMAVLTAFALLALMHFLDGLFSRHSILAGSAMLVCMSTFLERSAELRVDMLTSILGLLSLLALLRRRFLLAGVLVAGSFLVSQKGAYFVLASFAALGAECFFSQRRGLAFRDALKFAAAAGCTLALYLAAWSAVSAPGTVLRTVFLSPQAEALGNFYRIRGPYWRQTLIRNPFFYLASLAGLAVLFRNWFRGSLSAWQRMLAVYAALLAALCIWHRQPWPYFFVLLLPTLAIVIISVIDEWMPAITHGPRSTRVLAVVLYVCFGLLLPLSRIPTVVVRNNAFQKSTVILAENLLSGDDRYLAGMNILYDRRQSVEALSWLDAATLSALRERPDREVLRMVADLHKTKTRLLIYNYRIQGMPRLLQLYLRSQFEPLWGDVFIYSPRMASGTVELKFGGTYEVNAAANRPVTVDGQIHAAHSRLRLAAGPHRVVSPGVFRLKLLPDGWEAHADPRFGEAREMFSDVYSY